MEKKRKIFTRSIVVGHGAGPMCRVLGAALGFAGTEQRGGESVWVYSINVRSPLYNYAMTQKDAEALIELVREAGFNARFVDYLLTECYRSDYPGLDWSALIPDGGKYLEE